ncbi:flagellar biosynthetic protein FliO [Pseudomonas sp. PSKL.D1]|uniref:flagellar biosynthetic protein FliO n=1 Tax=Pseudomonas sp. PSKL.D1 TaxID=3029060 RepID=UPI002380C691|nr:flagellar biosynthetic protein FliO [Pseudomonas sp. PSKL.D1]WDY57896.1 flagellar biosynthetic protein FliO [Pseudomonas sp. PSKL.D1]
MTAATNLAPAASFGVPAEDLVGLSLLGKTALALVVVMACVLLCGWLASRLNARPAGAEKLVRVVGSSRLGQRERVVVVEVRGRWLVLGVTAQQVACLAELDAPSAADIAAPELAGRSFAARLVEALKQGGQRP